MAKRMKENRATQEEIDAMPAILGVRDVAHILGCTPQYVAKLCSTGVLKGCATKVGAWNINKKKALTALGLAD